MNPIRKLLVRLAVELFVSRGGRRAYVELRQTKIRRSPKRGIERRGFEIPHGRGVHYLKKVVKTAPDTPKPGDVEFASRLDAFRQLAETETPLFEGVDRYGEFGNLLNDIFKCPNCKIRLVASPERLGIACLCPKCGEHSPPLRVSGKDI